MSRMPLREFADRLDAVVAELRVLADHAPDLIVTADGHADRIAHAQLDEAVNVRPNGWADVTDPADDVPTAVLEHSVVEAFKAWRAAGSPNPLPGGGR